MSKSFGSIENTVLTDVLEDIEFRKSCTITKDQIEVCKECEFRYICTDCRAYVESPQVKNSKPLKCGYDPHSNEWRDWSSDILKKKAIEFYGLSEVI